MTERKVLGHIDCPACGTKAAMRVTHDKNGDPFGYCEHGPDCCAQLRIGGNPHRVAAFLALYPWAGKSDTVTAPAKPAEPQKIPVTVTEKKPAAPVRVAPVAVTAPAPAPAPAKPRSSFADAVNFLAGGAP